MNAQRVPWVWGEWHLQRGVGDGVLHHVVQRVTHLAVRGCLDPDGVPVVVSAHFLPQWNLHVTHRHTEREPHTHAHTQRDTHTHTEREREREREREPETETETERGNTSTLTGVP